ncbi:hypothetical protein EVAR_93613_1 [Eumeta japonica]|uniref:Uncharacterized protein n=1 Tax=Eumeta variegata TaxID=151549 RepID=A0A4C1TQL3_EUMVA|nr:hypothetical protein EVAR_93613_1 [Eumeta japonica]
MRGALKSYPASSLPLISVIVPLAGNTIRTILLASGRGKSETVHNASTSCLSDGRLEGYRCREGCGGEREREGAKGGDGQSREGIGVRRSAGLSSLPRPVVCSRLPCVTCIRAAQQDIRTTTPRNKIQPSRTSISWPSIACSSGIYRLAITDRRGGSGRWVVEGGSEVEMGVPSGDQTVTCL